jgi:hypothetical protein
MVKEEEQERERGRKRLSAREGCLLGFPSQALHNVSLERCPKERKLKHHSYHCG